jgi:hypothetical protein
MLAMLGLLFTDGLVTEPDSERPFSTEGEQSSSAPSLAPTPPYRSPLNGLWLLALS